MHPRLASIKGLSCSTTVWPVHSFTLYGYVGITAVNNNFVMWLYIPYGYTLHIYSTQKSISCLDNVTRCSLGILMYCWHALLCQRPNIFIWVSEIPSALADLAAPMRKLCVLYCQSSKPMCFKIVDNAVLKYCRVRGVPLAVINRGPSFFSLNTKYGSIALTGQTVCSVAPKKRLIPCRKGSVFDCLIVTHTTDGWTVCQWQYLW